MNQEVMDKVRGLENKLEYQIKKLVGLAEVEEKRGKDVVEDVEEGALILNSLRRVAKRDTDLTIYRSIIIPTQPICHYLPSIP